jgi:hypothetical protein
VLQKPGVLQEVHLPLTDYGCMQDEASAPISAPSSYAAAPTPYPPGTSYIRLLLMAQEKKERTKESTLLVVITQSAVKDREGAT